MLFLQTVNYEISIEIFDNFYEEIQIDYNECSNELSYLSLS